MHCREDGVGVKLIDSTASEKQQLRVMIDGLLAEGAWLDDRRRQIRREVRGPVVWRSRGVEVQSTLRDLSTAGAFVETEDAPAIGSDVYFYLPACSPPAAPSADVEVRGCRANTVHRNEGGFGVKFVSPSDEFVVALEEILTASR